MANMTITQDIENILKRKYAELNKVTPKTWKSSEFLAWKHKEIEKINQKFNDFLNKKGPQEASFYENMNPVYQNNVNKDFQQKEGLKQNSGKRVQNWVGLAMTEAENENRQTNFGQAYERLGIAGKVQSGLYKFSHLFRYKTGKIRRKTGQKHQIYAGKPIGRRDLYGPGSRACRRRHYFQKPGKSRLYLAIYQAKKQQNTNAAQRHKNFNGRQNQRGERAAKGTLPG